MSSSIAICGSFSFDSVIAPDGRPLTGKVGGNALWSALGAFVAGVAPRVVTIVGDDYPEDVIAQVAAAGIDVSAIRRIARSHPVRVTFVHLPDGGRLQPAPRHLIADLDPQVRAQFVDTTRDPQTLALGAPLPDDVPTAWLDEVTHWHLPLLPLPRHQALVALLSAAPGVLHSDCPSRSDLVGAPYERLRETLPGIDVFLPSTSDIEVIDPDASVSDVPAKVLDAGARTLVLKSGADGVIVMEDGRRWRVPAHPDSPVDPTGAGDAFCGGFLAGRALGRDLVEAAALGAAAASFAVAAVDPLEMLHVDPEAVAARTRSLLAAARSVDDVVRGGTR